MHDKEAGVRQLEKDKVKGREDRVPYVGYSWPWKYQN